jgi:hypothetical protein
VGSVVGGHDRFILAAYMKQHIEQLQRYTDVISDFIQKSLFNPDNMQYLNSLSTDQETQMTLPLSIFDNNPNVNSAILGVRINDEDYGEVEAYYSCVVEDRSKSNLIIVVDMPRGYDESAREFIDIELADALGHELQHSCEIPEIMNVQIPVGEEKWESVDNVWAHYASEVETKGYVTGFFLRALRYKKIGRVVDPYDAMEDYVINAIYQKGINKGLDPKLLQPVIKKLFTKWGTYMENLINSYEM